MTACSTVPARVGCAALVALTLLLSGCRGGAVADPPAPVRLRVSGASPAEVLVAEFGRGLAHATVTRVPPADPISVVYTLEQNDADVAVAFADAAYFANLAASASPEGGQLRAIAAMHVTPLYLVASGRSAIQTVNDLAGQDVRLGARTPNDPRFGPTQRTPLGQAANESADATTLGDLVVAAYGLPKSRVNVVTAALADTARRFEDGTLDAVFGSAAGANGDKWVQDAAAAGAHLIPLEGPAIERLRREYPFIQSVRIPAGTYAGQPNDVQTIGVNQMLICRRDLDVRVAYDLARIYVQALPRLAQQAPSLRLVNLENAPATAIPLHEGAARFYREWELFR